MQANINEFLARVPAESRRLLNRKSDLLNVLGNDVGSQIVVVGDTSSGKSSTMNFLFGFPINRESQGIGTRRPCVISMKPSPDREALAFRVTFHRAGCVDEALPDLDAVAAYVAEANDARRHPEWFPCLRDGYGMGPESAFDEEPIYLAIEHRDFMMAMRLVDLPGLTRRSELPMRIARSYIKPGNICLLIIGKDNPANGAFPKLAECMAKCSQNIFVQNFATEMRGSLEDNAEVLREEMRNAMGSEVRICLHCVDYGLPKTERNLQRRFWSDGKDQEDWWSIHQQQGPRQVQECMLAHEQRRAASLRECLEASQLSTAQFVPGLVGVLAKIFDFQTQSLPEVIADLEDQARAALAEEEEQVQEVRLEAKKLQNPPEWNTMLERAASVFREFLDATRAVGGAAPGDASDAGGAGVAPWTTDAELEACAACAGAECWYDKATDERIRAVLERHAGFQPRLPLRGLKSWHRLLDELTGALAFAPMPRIPQRRLLQALDRTGGGSSGTTHLLDTAADLVAELGYEPGRGPVRPLLAHFRERLLTLLRRDVAAALQLFERDGEDEDLAGLATQFLRVVRQDTPEMRHELLRRIQGALLGHVEGLLRRTIDGVPCEDRHGQAVLLPGTDRPRLQEASGLRVRRDENTAHASRLPSWSLPLKRSLLNGQVPMTRLQYESHDPALTPAPIVPLSQLCNPLFMRQPLQAAAPAARPAFAEDDMLDEVNLDDRTRTINCSNSVNLEIYLNATRCYEFQLHGGSTRAQYDLEVFKLLFALQVRVVEDWASRWEGMLQRLLDEGTASRFLEGRLRQELREQGQLGVFEGRAEQAREGLRSVFQYWHGTSVDERSDTVLTTFEEVNRSRADWPGFASLEQYQARLEELGGTCSLGFLGKKDERLTCQASWRRLCEEFALWGLLLTMPKITDAELASTDPSTGIAMAAGPQERAAKLTRHRLDRLSRKGPAVFKKRLLYLVKRDVEAGLRRLPRSAPPAAPAPHAPQPGAHEGAPHATRLGDQDLRNWLEQHLVGFADSVVTEEMGFVKQAYAGLSPFDFCTLNGRSKLDHRALRSQHFELNVAGTAAPKVDAHEVKTALKEAWEAPEKSCWPGLHLTVRTDGAFLAASAETTLALYKNVVERRVERVDEIMNLKLAERPYASQEGGTEYAGGMQHQLLLMFFKVVHVDAINHCRPRLNKMMADMYHQRNLLRALQESPELDYLRIYGPRIAEKRLELERRESRLAQKRRVLALWGAAPEPLPEPGHGAGAGAEAERPEPQAAEP